MGNSRRLEKKYHFLSIRRAETFAGRPVYRIYNIRTGDQLGILSWYVPWKKYVFSSQPQCVFDDGCLRDVLDFLETEAKA